MPSLTIPDLDDATLSRLRARAAAHGHSEAEEARGILTEHLIGQSACALGSEETLDDAMRAIFAPLGGYEFPLVREAGQRPPPDFSGPEWDLPRSPK